MSFAGAVKCHLLITWGFVCGCQRCGFERMLCTSGKREKGGRGEGGGKCRGPRNHEQGTGCDIRRKKIGIRKEGAVEGVRRSFPQLEGKVREGKVR